MSNENLQAEMGREIRRRREALGLTLDDLATRSGLTQNYVGSVENGHRDPSLSTLLAVAKGLSVRPADLFSEGRGLSAAAREMAALFDLAPPEMRTAIRTILRDAATKRKPPR